MKMVDIDGENLNIFGKRNFKEIFRKNLTCFQNQHSIKIQHYFCVNKLINTLSYNTFTAENVARRSSK